MSRVIGLRIDEELHAKLKQYDKPITEIMRQALDDYLAKTKTDVNGVFTGVNKEIFENKYQALTKLIDKHLNALNRDSTPICCICNDPIENGPYKTFGSLSYCSRLCWLNADTKLKGKR